MDLESYCEDTAQYGQWQNQQLMEWESLCKCCGACCGMVDGDPCEHLAELVDRKYTCQIYESRFGLHKIRSGRPFKCVPIRDILHESWLGNHACAYKK